MFWGTRASFARMVPCHLSHVSFPLPVQVEGDRYVLHDMFQRMRLRLLKVVTPVNWIEPGVQKVLRPLSIPHNDARRRQSFLILRNDKVYPITLQVAKRLDNAVWRHHGLVDDHELFEAGGGEK